MPAYQLLIIDELGFVPRKAMSTAAVEIYAPVTIFALRCPAWVTPLEDVAAGRAGMPHLTFTVESVDTAYATLQTAGKI